MKKYIAISVLAIILLLSGVKVSYARELTSREVSAVINILQVFDLDSAKVANIKTILESNNVPVNDIVKACLPGEKFSRIDGTPCPGASDTPDNTTDTTKPATTLPQSDNTQTCYYKSVYDSGVIVNKVYTCEPKTSSAGKAQA